MADKRLAYGAAIAVLMIAAAGLLIAMTAPQPGGRITVRQSGGAGLLVMGCYNETYLSENADYIIEGTVGRVESRWNDGNTSIVTYTDFSAERYVKGTPFANSNIQIVTPGGTVGEISQVVEDQPILHEGARARLYLEKIGGEFTIFCGHGGVVGL